MNLHDVLRAVIRADAALLNDAKWVERAVRAIAAHEARYPSPAVPAAPEPAAVPDARDDEIAELKAQLAAQAAPAPEAQPDPRDAEIAALRAQLAATATTTGLANLTGTVPLGTQTVTWPGAEGSPA